MEKINKAPASRPKRIPVGTRNRFEVVNKDPDFEYRVVTDRDNRIQMFLDAGYEVAPASESAQIALSRVDAAQPEGKHSLAIGGGQTGILMRIPKEYYEEDQKAKLEVNKKLVESIEKPEGSYGNGVTYEK